MSRAVREDDERLRRAADPGAYDEDEVSGLAEPMVRYFRAAVASGAPLARAADLDMRGRLRLNGRWLRFRAHEVLAPHDGFVWRARVAGVITGSHLRIDDEGHLEWVRLDRWGDPDQTGEWEMHPFGFQVTETRRFGPFSIPAAGTAGWFHGTDRWADGQFFRCDITSLAPIIEAPAEEI